MEGKVHIFGGTGLLGSNLAKVCELGKIPYITYSRFGPADINIDISQKKSFKELPKPSSRDYVVNLAAIAQPGKVFNDPKKAYEINVLGSKNIIDWTESKCKAFFYMSSVEVFDGSKIFYEEDSIVCPLNLYGQQKAESENYINTHYKSRYIIGRTSWNISNNNVGRCLIDVMLKSLSQKGAKMATDNIFTIASAYETATNIMKCLDSEFSGTIHIASPTPISRYEIAKLIIDNHHNKLLGCEPCLFSDLSFIEARSKRNVLKTSLSIEKFNASYSDPEAIILKKVFELGK
tara:strand:- start:172 stop:1044 length:873 start_codon:yes stop_codon:yes gene_type:complete